MARKRWQYPYLPYGKVDLLGKVVGAIERIVKSAMFGCMMCGNCLLQKTEFICPMRCPKGLRNGPCGGSSKGRCYVDETRLCVWHLIYEKSFTNQEEEKLLEVLPPIDGEKRGRSAWLDLFCKIEETGFRKFLSDPGKIFQSLHQPDWWRGDAEYHSSVCVESVSNLEKELRSGFVVTCEINPPISCSEEKLKGLIDSVRPYVSAINLVSNPSANTRISSWATSLIAMEQGVEPILQIASRDINRINLQSLATGANMHGIKNILCLTGDSSSEGLKPRISRTEVDIDAIQILWILRRMRDEGKYLDGREIKFPPKFFLGAAASPFSSNPKFQALREEKKVNAGAQFFQTNLVFDLDGLEIWLNELSKRNLFKKVFILVGIAPLKSLKMAQNLNNVPGVFVPEEIIKRMERASEKNGAQEEGVQIALEFIDRIKLIDGINGIHLMPIFWEEVVSRIVREAGLLR